MELAAEYAPVAMAALVATIGYIAAPYVAHIVPIPNMVIALAVGIALNPVAARPAMQPGMAFCVRTVLRWAVALLGLRALNSAAPLLPSLAPAYAPVKSVLVEASTVGPAAGARRPRLGYLDQNDHRLGWRHVTTVLGTTLSLSLRS